jgi:hypothetical protein
MDGLTSHANLSWHSRIGAIMNLRFLIPLLTLLLTPAIAGAAPGHGSNGNVYQYPWTFPSLPPTIRGVRPQHPVFGPVPQPGQPKTRAVAKPPTVQAQPRSVGPAIHFRGRDFRTLNPAERADWLRGRWHHGCRNRICGWWWFTGTYWYWYAAPIYPYPDYISTYEAEESDEEAPAEATPPPDLSGDTYYYCADPSGYYPEISACNVPWEAVSAGPTK